MNYSIATVSVPGELKDKLTAISSAGFDGIEIFEHDLITFNDSSSQLAKLVADFGLRIDLYQPGYEIHSLTDIDRSRALGRLERTFDLMEGIGAKLLLLSRAARPLAADEQDQLVNDLIEFGACAARRGIKIGYEETSSDKVVPSLENAWEVVQKTDQKNVGLVLDGFHISRSASEMEIISSIPGDRIFHVQLSDAPSTKTDQNRLTPHSRLMPGEGELPLSEFMLATFKAGYDGPVSLEITNDDFRGAQPRIVANDGYRSLLYLVDQVSSKLPNIAAKTPAMPAQGPVKSVEFIEFAANESDAEELADTFGKLGFTPVAKHISKSVTLWQQGDIRLLINTETSGYARSAYVVHGLCVCDMGLLVSDADAAMARAKLLGANVHLQSIGESELNIPAVRGVAGSIVHFLDRKSVLSDVWNKEFTPTQGAEANDVGLTKIDHVAHTMTQNDLHSWTLFYLSVFDLEKTPLVQIDDPRGTVTSRAVESRDGQFRLTMNGVTSHRTFAGRFYADSIGSAVQHIAFASNDLVKTAKEMYQKGFKALQYSENYYSSLASRFDLDEDFVKELAHLNIMYDRDEDGEYLQLYGKPFGEGFFFEIVERRIGYGAYGGANATYRTAAQRQLGRPEGMPRR